ncbi:hypothetical protein CPJCM30710_11160 [Clostridium polyendosporum]|uniref:Uncharacterized protein n=1 Tax=Clostridium polyendosporum TaxID=69208 RepID=A0A919RZN8_9CLOT|nr:hypothetical protein CPJCM30710_11160 [Clostridium polyendosporum]
MLIFSINQIIILGFCTRAFKGELDLHIIFTELYNNIAEGYVALCDWIINKAFPIARKGHIT